MWAFRSALVSVAELDRSSTFYQEVMQVNEIVRHNEVAVLSKDDVGSFTIFLRLALRDAARAPHDTLGLRAVSIDVGSFEELDRVEKSLRAHDGLRDRRELSEGFEVVRGFDPDRNPLVLVAWAPDKVFTPDHFREATQYLYALDP
jgi:catechol 2,3-dioxygenase-like lactoylglutathione lyase family enzyme